MSHLVWIFNICSCFPLKKQWNSETVNYLPAVEKWNDSAKWLNWTWKHSDSFLIICVTQLFSPVEGGRRLGLPLHVQSVEVHVVESSSYPVLSVPLETIDQGPGCVSNHIHSVYDDRCVGNRDTDRQTDTDTDRQKDRHRQAQRDTDRHRQKHRQTQTDTDRQTETQTGRFRWLLLLTSQLQMAPCP